MNIPSTFSRLVVLLLIVLFTGACSRKTSLYPFPSDISRENIQDVIDFPQNLEVYARAAGAEKRLLPASTQQNMDANFNNIWFGPWEMRRSTIRRAEVAGPFRRPRGYRLDGSRWTDAQWQAMRTNGMPASFPSRATPAITLRRTDLREMPTHDGLYVQPLSSRKKDPFDYFQYSSLPPGMPLLIAHTSGDGRWHYIECPIAGGWVDAADIAPVNEEFAAKWRNGTYAALIKDGVPLLPPRGGQRGVTGDIGAILPFAGHAGAGNLRVFAPVRQPDGNAGITEIQLEAAQASVKPLPLTPGNVAQIGNRLMGQTYGWGGANGLRDCSAMIRDIYAPFGIWLPRNSRGQAKRGAVISLGNLDLAEKEKTILQDGVPFLSLIGMPGHITMYVGAWKNRPAIFHNAWGLRIIKDGDDDNRFILGRAVVTSITPGMELPNLYLPKTFTDRIATLTTPGK